MHTGLPIDRNGAPIQAMIPGKSNTIAFTATPETSVVFEEKTKLLWLYATKSCWIRIGTELTAEAGNDDGESFFLPGGTWMNRGLVEEWDRLSVVRDTENGILYYTQGI